MKKIAALSVLLAIAAAGCASPEMIAAKVQAELREDEAHCRSLGFQFGTDSFKLYFLNLQQGREIYQHGYSSGYSSGNSAGLRGEH